MRFVIAGAGALGTVYAVLLAQAGADVCVLTRPSRVEALRGEALFWRKASSSLRIDDVAACRRQCRDRAIGSGSSLVDSLG